MKKVVCFGEVLWDVFPSGQKPGGAPMNVAFHLQKQGVESLVISAVGKDELGDELLHHMEKNSLDTSLVQRNADLPTGTVDVILDGEGKASYTINQPVSWDNILFRENFKELVRQADAFVFGSLASRSGVSGATLAQLLEAATFRVFDLNLRWPHFSNHTIENLLHQTDLLKINDEELAYLKLTFNISGDDSTALAAISSRFDIQTICVTQGERGATLMHGTEFFSHQGFQVKVTDTVGSGDAFLATLIRGIVNHLPLEVTLRRANAVGALVATKAGANPDYDENEIAVLLGT